ncbi:hypothetical protein QJS10_CPB17g01685 [Acorus calamus]|uniref:ARM repeat superfamily protein n=1 Tax=Acorus calamus TaxID=4465 RepID=A0AAV9CUU8_ACOCL|nr:hypothetical protein QJS10_CPB17g01685 [Acorus calamus]
MAEPSKPTAEIRTDDAEREEMLDRMLTRLALADDSNLQHLLTSLLPYTISSISSPSPSIRNSVMEILTHVNKRVKHQPEIGLPFTELWKIYSEANAAPIVRNFCMVYIEMAFERMLAEDKMTLAPDLVVKVSELPLKHQDIVLRIVAKVIGDCHSIQIAENIVRNYKAIGLGRDRQLFIEFCLHTVLYQPPSQSSECPAGLSVAQSDRVTGKLPLKSEFLLARKMGILNVIEAMDLAPELVYPLYIAACSDSQESVVKRGEELLKRKAAGVNLEDSDLIGRLFFLFNGTVVTTNVAQELKVSPGSPALRARLMSVFCRSIIAANSFPSTLQCIFGCFYGNGTTSRLKQLGMEFTVWVFKQSRMDQLKLMGPVILSGIVRSLDDFLNSGIDQFLRLTIQESTNSLAVAYKDAPANVIKDLEMLLSEHCKALYVKEALSLQEEQSEVRFCAVREMALENLFPSRDRGHHSVDKNTDFKYPKLHDMLDYICKQQPLLLDSTEKWGDKLLFPSKMYVAMINFLLKCFEADFEQDGRTHEFHYVETLCELLERAMIFEGSVELHATASKALISIASCLPELVASRYARKISWVRQLLGHVDSATRESASRLLGITCSAISSVEASALISDLVSSINGTQKLSSRKEERRAGTVWLLSLTMYCGRHSKIQMLLPEIQELASQGMSIVYELGDSSMKQNLVNALVSTLTGSGKRKRAIKLMEDSEVFQAGSIGESLSGGKLSTYKELCGLANEMATAFVPRLLDQYEDKKQDAMGHIWKSIVADPKKTIDEYFDLIIDDLLVQSGSRLWRSREASCLALADIIQGRKFDQVSQHLRRIWVAAFRAMDDIKETVRNSGDSLCRAVSSLTVRLCDISLTSAADASRTMDIVLPFLLLEGIVSKVDSVRKASVSIVMKLSKGAGTAIRPHLPDLVCCMLESLSSLEDQTLNYVELHASNVGIRTEKLENLRIAVAKDSPMWETLDLCLKVINSQSLGDLVPRLAQLVRSGVGLNTRVGVASFISLMVQKVNAEIKPFTSILLKLLFPAVLEERSAAAKRAFASACAIVLKYAGPSQAQKLIEETAALHVGDRNAQISCAILLKNYSSFAADVVSGYLAITVPVTFIARFEDDKDVSKVFEELWEENTSSERVTLQLYLAEIVLLLCDGVASSSWSNKKKVGAYFSSKESAKAIRNLSEVLGESLSSFQSDLLNCLLKEIPGRLWEGKDAILYATASLCTSCHKSMYAADPATPNTVLSAISSACAKKGKAYREAAFSCLQQVMTAFGNPDFFGRVFPLLFEVCSQASVAKPGNASLINADTRSGEDHVEEDFSAPLDKVIDCVTSCIHLARVQDILGQGKSLMFSNVAPKVIECISAIKIAQVHIAASECLLDMTKLYKSIPPTEREAVAFKDELIHLCEVEKNEQAKSLLRGCINILNDVTPEGTTK